MAFDKVTPQLLASILDKEPAAVYLIDDAGFVVWANTIGLQLAETTIDAILSEKITSLKWNLHSELFAELLERAKKQKISSVLPLQTKNGLQLCLVHIFRLKHNGKIYYSVTMIGLSHFAMPNLPQATSPLNLILSTGIIILQNGKIVFQNEMAESLFEHRLGDPLRLPTPNVLSQFLFNQKYNEIASKFSDLETLNEHFEMEWYYQQSSGLLRFVEIKFYPLTFDYENLVLIIIRDITRTILINLRLFAYTHGLPEFQLLLDEDFKLLNPNPLLTEIFGYETEELAQMTLTDLFSSKAIKETLQEASELQIIHNFELKGKSKNGRDLIFLASAEKERIGDDNCFLLSCINIPESFISGDRQLHLITRNSDLYQSISIAILSLDSRGYIVRSNLMASKLTQYSQEELHGMHIDKLFLPVRSSNIQFSTQINSKFVQNYQVELRRKDNSILFVGVASIISDKGGMLLIHDISQFGTTLRTLLQNERLYNQLLSQLPAGVIITDLNNIIVLANDAMGTILGQTPDELMGKSIIDFVDKRAMKKIHQMTKLRRNGVTSTYEIQLIRKDNIERIVRITAGPYTDQFGVIIGTLGIIEDITEQKRTERLKEFREQEIALYGRLLRHDLRNDLGLVYSNIEAVQMMEPTLSEDSILFLKSSLSIIDRMTELIRHFERPQDVWETNLIQYLTELAQTAMNTDPSLKINIESTHYVKSIRIIADNLLSLVFYNLFRNAAQHAGPHPTVTISVTREGHFAAIKVCDNGPGVSDDLRDRLFERGASTKTKGGGLGLHLSREIILSRGGTMDLLPKEEGVGACFLLKIPVDYMMPYRSVSKI